MKFRKNSKIVRLELDNQVVSFLDLKDKWDAITVGRASDNTWRVDSDQVNPHHARIEKKKGKVFLEYVDNVEKNGIYLLGARMKGRFEMRSGEVYRLGRGNCSLSLVVSKESSEKKNVEQYHKLEQLTGKNKGKIYQIRKKETENPDTDAGGGLPKSSIIIGSDDSADIVIKEEWISRRHVSLELKDECCFIYDGAPGSGSQQWKPSSNGTKVDQEDVMPWQKGLSGRQLLDGQVISLAHVDLRFWDKNAVHIRSHFFLRLAIVLMTVAIVVSGYIIFLSIGDDSGELLRKARQCASVENWEGAREYSAQSADARGAENYASKRMELLRNLDLWEKTSVQWEKIRGLLQQEKGQDWKRINSMFAELIYPYDVNWKWNSTTAPQKMKVAQSAQNLISAMLTAEEFLRSSGDDFAYQEQILERLSASSAAFRESAAQFPALLKASGDVMEEMNRTRQDYREASGIMASYTAEDKAQSVFENIRRIRTRNAEHVSERLKQHLSASSAVMRYCDDMLVPLELLGKTETILQRNYEAIARMDFDRFSNNLSLPTAQQSMVSKKLADRCTEMRQTCERQQKIVEQMKFYKDRFNSEGFSADRIPSVLTDLFDDENLEKVLTCDCLGFRPPGIREKDSLSVYDSILGVYAFYAYLDSPDGTWDSTLFENRFRPVLVRSLEVFDLLKSYQAFCYAENDPSLVDDMSAIRDIEGDNLVMDLASNAEKTLERKKSLIRKLLQTALSQPDDRRGVIAGGMVCCLAGGAVDFVPDDFREQVYLNHRKLHKKLGDIQSRNANTPEERKASEEQILSLGVPGDSFLRQPWSDRFQK